MKHHLPRVRVPVLGLESTAGRCFWETDISKNSSKCVLLDSTKKNSVVKSVWESASSPRPFRELKMNFQWGYGMWDVWNLFNNKTPFPQRICQGVSWNILWELNSPVGHKVIWAQGPGEKGNNTLLTFNQQSTPAGQFGKRRNPFFNHGTERVSHFPWTTLIPDPPDPPATQPRTPQSHTLNLHFYFLF